MADAQLGILIKAKNDASGALKQVKADIAGLDKAAGAVSGGLSTLLTGGIGGVLGGLGLGVTVAALDQFGAAIDQAVAAADRFNKVGASFKQLAQTAGQSSEEMLEALRSASNGMINDTDLMLAANKSMMLGVADTGEEMAALLNVARARGQAMGLDVGQAFNDIVTGLGRESALILDNLGIQVDATAAQREYAAALGTTADKLDAAQRKQALLNAVMEQSKNITVSAPTGPGAAIAQAQVAQQNAQVAAGQFFAPYSRDWAQLQADAINSVMGKQDEFAVKIREVNDLIADNGAPTMFGFRELDGEQAQRFQELAAALALVSDETQVSVLGLQGYRIQLAAIAQGAVEDIEVNDRRAAAIAAAAAAIKKADAENKAYLDTLRDMDPHMARAIAAQREVATAEEIAAAQATLAKYSMDAFAQAMAGANAMSAALVGGLSSVQAQAGATAGIIYNLTGAINQLHAVSNAHLSRPDAIDQVLPQVEGMVPGLMNNMSPDEALAWMDEQKRGLYDQATALREMTDESGRRKYSEDEIALILRGNVQQTQSWASGLDKVATGASDAKKEFEAIKGLVRGILDDSQKLDDFKASDLYTPDELKAKGLKPDDAISADMALNGGVRPDAVNENARRLAAIAKEGFIGQDWLEEFKAEVPGVYADLMLKQAEGLDLRTAALQIMQEFQAGLRPELNDRQMIKDRVKAMIIGDQNAAALAEEIATEIATEMNIPFQDALAAASGALGVKGGGAGKAADAAGATAPTDMTGSGASAGTSFMAGFLANADGTLIVAGIVAKMAAEFPKFRDNGAHAGTQWGAGFMGTVETGIAQPLITLLTTLVTPGVLAAMQTAGTQTTPP